MTDIKKENSKYFDSVMQSVIALHKTEDDVKIEKKAIYDFVDFLTKKADETGKFHAVENEIVEYLKNYKFDGKIDFTPVCIKLDQLSPIKQKLGELVIEAKKLKDKPDRYNCQKAMETCRKLTQYCVNDMTSANYDKVTAALDANTPKLRDIQEKFERENQIKSDINQMLQRKAAVLKKYPAFKSELQQFLASFPNDPDADKKTVESRLVELTVINKLSEEADSLLAKISNYTADRYNKTAIVRQAENALSSTCSSMITSTIRAFEAELKKNIADLTSVINAFEKESQFLADLKKLLHQHSSILNKFSAFKAELQQFLAATPNDRKTIENRLAALSEINKLTEETDNLLAKIRNYADRFNKNAVLLQTENTLSFAYSIMRISDINKFEVELIKNNADIRNVINDFDKERKKITELRDRLKNNFLDMWKEDNDQFITELDDIIKKGTENSNFDGKSFTQRIKPAEGKKKQDIENIKLQYKWLKKERYTEELSKLTGKNTELKSFQSGIEHLLKSRGIFTKFSEIFQKK